ncbi:MAG: hypothetical protein JSS79_07540 [Bacteroidetes bacterium]|nr:hypothetical protein [Bacteroidota bacterium]
METKIEKSRGIIFLSVILLSNIAYSQNSDHRYLLYQKNIHTSIDRKTKELKIDTVLEVRGFIWKRGYEWFACGSFLDSPWGIKIKMKTEGEKAFFTLEENDVEGIILKDSLLKTPMPKFVLIPLRKGIKVNPFKDQSWTDQQSVKIFFERKDLVRRGKLNTQGSCAIIPVDSSISILQCGKMIYGGEEQNNVIVSESLYAFIQVIKISNIRIEVNFYPRIIRAGRSIISKNNYKVEPLKDNSIVTSVQGKLVGDWETKTFYKFNAVGLEALPYRYDFHFLKNQLIIEKEYKGSGFKNRTDTMIYELHPSAEYFIIDREKSKTRVSTLFINKIESETLTVVMDEVLVTEDGHGNRAIKVLIELKRK